MWRLPRAYKQTPRRKSAAGIDHAHAQGGSEFDPRHICSKFLYVCFKTLEYKTSFSEGFMSLFFENLIEQMQSPFPLTGVLHPMLHWQREERRETREEREIS